MWLISLKIGKMGRNVEIVLYASSHESINRRPFLLFLRWLYNKINSNMSKYRPVASFCLQGGAIQPEDGPDEVSRGGFGCPPLHFKRFEGCKMLKVKIMCKFHKMFELHKWELLARDY